MALFCWYFVSVTEIPVTRLKYVEVKIVWKKCEEEAPESQSEQS